MRQGRIIVVEGIIGSSKSTFCQSYAACNDNVVVLKEWVDDNILMEYINDMPNKAKSFQFRAQAEVINNYKQAEILAKEGKTVLIDRGIYGNLVFATMQMQKGYINAYDFEIYKSNIADLIEYFRNSNVRISTWLLKCAPHVALQRITKRARNGENNYTLDYLIELDNRHMQTIKCDKILDTSSNYVLTDVCELSHNNSTNNTKILSKASLYEIIESK